MSPAFLSPLSTRLYVSDFYDCDEENVQDNERDLENLEPTAPVYDYKCFSEENIGPNVDTTFNGTDNPALELKNDKISENITLSVNTDNIVAVDNNANGFLERCQNRISDFYSFNKWKIKIVFIIVAIILYTIFLGFALARDYRKALPLLIITLIFVKGIFYYKIVKRFVAKPFDSHVNKPFWKTADRIFKIKAVKWLSYLGIAIGITVGLVIDTANNRLRLISVGGLFVCIFVCFILSTNPAKIRWRPVIWGILLQFIFGILVLRWRVGFIALDWVATQIVKFLDYTQRGTAFIYGFLVTPPNICGMSPIFIFTVLQTIIFFGSVVSLLYYFGVMQFVLKRMAWFMQITLGTTAAESFNAAACIFLGMTEAPLMIKPYLSRMTKSEIHAVLVSGYACIAGSLFAAYASFGACPVYLLSGSVMSAPAALAVAKLLLPETEESKLKNIEDLKLPPSEEGNLFEAISVGASTVVEIIWHIVANLIVFIALLAFIDNVIAWLADMVGWELTFQKLMGYLFLPLALAMGCSDSPVWEKYYNETFVVAQLMGTKTVLNEFIAYNEMGKYAQRGELEGRSEMMATFALLGFSNLAGIGIQLGFLGSICPEKKPLVSEVVLRALFGGTIACWMTACVAGILVVEPYKCLPTTAGHNCTVIP